MAMVQTKYNSACIFSRFVLLPASLSLALSCSQVPLTHRTSLHLVSDSELASLASQQYDEVLDKSKLSRDQAAVERVRMVGMRIARAVEEFNAREGRGSSKVKYSWEFNLIQDDKIANAWVLPGGKAAVYTGILPITRDDVGLAVVLGHEAAHALAGHGSERMSQGLMANLGEEVLSAALSNRPEETRQLFDQLFGAGVKVGFILPYSRLQESEADRIGLTLMAMAGFDPREAIAFWQRMNQSSQSRPPEFLSTHPAPETRISDIRKYIAEALPYYEQAKKQ